MMSTADIPFGFRGLFESSGPVLQYRLLRDVLGEDDSYVRTAKLCEQIAKLPEARTIFSQQSDSGDWGGTLAGKTPDGTPNTEFAFLRLCELGLDGHRSLEVCLETALMPALISGSLRWEYAKMAQREVEEQAIANWQRDKILRLICRARLSEADFLRVKPLILKVLSEWERFPEEPSRTVPTRDAFAALCWYPWSEDEFPKVREVVVKVLEALETRSSRGARQASRTKPYALRLPDKGEYLQNPARFFEDLELIARLGVLRDTNVGNWMLEELEAHQDADGWFRFDARRSMKTSWYFPLEKTDPSDWHVEWSFRAAMIYKLLEYDL